MSFIENITPKDTEEVKPGLFIQKTNKGYRQVYPAAWNGKINISNFIFGGKPISSTLFFMLILFLVWSYQHDIKEYKNFYYAVQENPLEICPELMAEKINSFDESSNSLVFKEVIHANTNSL